MRRTARERQHMMLLALLVAGYGAHYLVWCWPQPWFIEDAAISFSYARNLVDGEGLVTYPGGERVEGYSNALWMFLMAAWQLIGVTPWISAKVMGFVFGALTLPLSWLIARRALPEDDAGVPPHATLLAPLLLAASTQFVVWNDSGLENSLFNFLLALSVWRLCVEIQDDRRAPWSALAFFALSMTRPDGIAYVALGLVARTLGTLRRRQWAAWPLWLVAFLVPYGLYNLWRYDYFAWWYPNTYYAKKKNFQPFSWNAGGWKQLKEWAVQYYLVWGLPLPLVALVGLRRWRVWVVVLVCALLAGLLLWNGRDGLPSSVLLWWSPKVASQWQKITVWYLLVAAVGLGLLTLRGRGWEARALLWASLCTGVFFWVWSYGDWMKGFRWGSQLSVPLFTLCALGIGAVAAALPSSARTIKGRVQFGTLYGLLLAIALGAPNIRGSYEFAMKPETSPNSVHRRVNYMQWVQRRLHVDRVTLLDVDMGAHMWWSGWDIADMAGLVDVPVAHHDWEKEFTEEYIFGERRPEFAHVHGSWANNTRIPRASAWSKTYFEVPGYPTGAKALHVGNHVRKDLLVSERWEGPADRRVAFAGGVTLEGWDVPAPRVAAGGKLYIDSGWSTAERSKGFRVLVLLAPEAGDAPPLATEVVPGYDWYRPDIWAPADVVRGRWSVPLPATLASGAYRFGLVVLDEASGQVLAGPGAGAARYMNGEWLSDLVVEVGSVEQAVAAANEVYQRGLNEATEGFCEVADTSFGVAKRHVARHDAWQRSRQPAMDEALVACYLRRAQGFEDPLERANVLAAARVVDHRNEALIAVARPLGAELEAAGDAAAAAEDWQAAYTAYSAALSVDPRLSWARRKAEDMRDRRLALGEYKGKPKPRGAVKKPPPPELDELRERTRGLPGIDD